MPNSTSTAADRLRAAETPTEEVPRVGVFDPPISQQVAALVKQATNGSGGTDRGFPELARIVERAEIDRADAELRKYEGQWLVEAHSLTQQAIRQADDRRQVDPALIRKAVALWSNWAAQRGAISEGGGS